MELIFRMEAKLLTQVHLKNIARYSDAKLEKMSKINFVYGPNGSGKSTISRQLKNLQTHPETVGSETFSIEPEQLQNQFMVFDNSLVKNLFQSGPELTPIYTTIENLEIREEITSVERQIESKTYALKKLKSTISTKTERVNELRKQLESLMTYLGCSSLQWR